MALVALVATACAPAAPLPSPRQAPSDGPAGVEVRSMLERPRMVLVRRQGDPRPALVLAMAPPGARPSQLAGLAELLGARLAQAGHGVVAHADGHGVRLVSEPRTVAKVRALLQATAEAIARPLVRQDPAIAAIGRRVARLRRHAADGSAMLPLADCSGELALDPTDPLIAAAPAALAAGVDRARLGATARHLAVGFVGPSALADATAEALAATSGWLRPAAGPSAGPAVPEWPSRERDGAASTASLPPGAARLEIAWWMSGAASAVSTAVRLGQTPSPLSARLALLGDWQLDAVSGSARPAGGCVRLGLSSQRSLGPDEAARAAGAAVRTLRRELTWQAHEPALAGLMEAEIQGAPLAVDAAARGAWWALAHDVDREPSMDTALLLGAERDAPEAEIGSLFRAALLQSPALAGPALEARAALEPGQGRLWMMLAGPCSIDAESTWDAGRSALALAAAAARARPGRLPSAVTITPWIDHDGVGLMAHAAPSAAEDGAALARRVASSLGAALADLPLGELPFQAAHDAAVVAGARDGRSLLFGWAELASPDHPSQLLPLGDAPRVAGATRGDVDSRLRTLLLQPWRLALLAQIAAQPEVARAEIARWLVDGGASGSACPAAAPPAPLGGVHSVPTREPWTTILVGLVGSASPEAARLTAAALATRQGVLARTLGPDSGGAAIIEATARALGPRTVLLSLKVDHDAAQTAEKALGSLFAELRGAGLPAADLARARQTVEREDAVAMSHPGHRLATVWRHGTTTPRRLSDHRYAAWLRHAVAVDRTVMVIATRRADGEHPR